MSKSMPIYIPQNILDLPTVTTAFLYNSGSKLVVLSNINESSLLPDTTQDVRTLHYGHDVRAVDVSSMDKATAELARDNNSKISQHFYRSSVKNGRTAVAELGVAALFSAVSTCLAYLSVDGGLKFIEMPSCRPQAVQGVVDASCDLGYAQLRSDLKIEAGLSGLGAVVLVMAAAMAFKSGLKNRVDSRVDLVKVAMAQGNIAICQKQLDNIHLKDKSKVSLQL